MVEPDFRHYALSSGWSATVLRVSGSARPGGRLGRSGADPPDVSPLDTAYGAPYDEIINLASYLVRATRR